MNLIETDNLTIGYDNKALIEDISLLVEAGKIVTLIGPNGSGKSTLLKTVAGFIQEIGGCIFIDAVKLGELSDSKRAEKMSVMMTNRSDAQYATCREVIEVGRYPHTGLLGRLSKDDERIVDEIITLTGIKDLEYKNFDKLSDGQKQKVLLARALVQEPKVIILDEPTSFLDVGYKLEFMRILKDLAAKKGIGVLMSLHELDLAKSISDTVIAITSDNKIGKCGSADEVLTSNYISELFCIKNGSYKIENSSFVLGKKTESKISKEVDNKKTRFLMVQGTMSSAGKSLVVAGLCRIFKQDGKKVAPFKSQNMALNSYITEDGLEMGRAQVMQAQCAGIKPQVYMNPILLKPTDDSGSQVIVNGVARQNMRAREYFKYKTSLIPDIKAAIDKLSEEFEIIVIEGAGSPAEINLKQNDIVNMGMAKLVDAPVLLVGDIDRGGVFAQLLGTLELLEDDERDRVKGLIVNKFRGDKTILDPGISMLEERGKIPVVGVLPYMDVNLEDEDSLTSRFEKKQKGILDIVVLKLPHISNFTDFDVFEQVPGVSVRYVREASDIGTPDLFIIPGSKNTIDDMRWVRESGMEIEIGKLHSKDIPIIGICGGYQMLGDTIEDPDEVEAGGLIHGLGLLPVSTRLNSTKKTLQVEGKISACEGAFSILSDKHYEGYEIHMGETVLKDASSDIHEFTEGNTGYQLGNVYGTYVHGFFDKEEIVSAVIKVLSDKKNANIDTEKIMDFDEFKQKEYDKLADIMRQYLDMDAIYKMLGLS